MKIKKLLCMALVGSMILSVPVFAAEESDVVTEESASINITNDNADSILFEDLAEHQKIVSNDDFVSLDALSERFDMESITDGIMVLASIGDQYEPNNTPQTATAGLAGKKVKATIHDESDWDWYKIDILDTSIPYSFVLMDIPNGCDYDLYLITEDLQDGYAVIQEGNTTEQFYLNFNEIGTYYISVQSYSGYSNSPYTLYFGPSYKVGDTGWLSGWSFSFGNVPRGSYAHSVPAQNLNLTNDSSIPNGSVMTSLYMTADGSTTEWAGFYKYMVPSSGSTLSQIGNIQKFVVPDMTYYVKQNWQIYGTIEYSKYFTWTPRIFIAYKFVVAPQTIGYLN